jgi:hypothetical protein
VSVSGSQSVQITSFVGSQISAVAGNGQSAAAGVAFAVPLEIQVRDAFGNPVSGAAVTFAAPSSGPSGHFNGNATVTTNALGLATAPSFTANGTLGSFAVSATDTADGISTSFQLTNLVGAPALVTAIGNTTQNTPMGFPYGTLLQVKVTDAFGNAIANVPVTFSAPAVGASGTFNALPTVPTDALGIATAPAFTANHIRGSFQVTAVVGGVASPATFTLTNTAIPATISALAGSGQKVVAGGAAFAKPLQVKVVDASKNPVSDITMVFELSATGPGGTFAGSAAVVTNASGVATAPALTPNTVAGTFTVVASVTGVATPAAFTLTIIPGAPAAINAFGGTPQSTAVTKAFQPVEAQVLDSFGNGVGGVKVTFTAPATGATGTFGGKTTATVLSGPNGVAMAPAFTANTHAGKFTVTATATGVATSTSFSLTNMPGPVARLTPVSGTTPQSASPHAAFAIPLAVIVTDAFGNVETGVVVTFTVHPSTTSGASATFGGSLTATATTDATGTASLSSTPALAADGSAGTFTVIATDLGVAARGIFTLTIT